MRRMIFALSAALLLAGCGIGQQGETYPVAIDDARKTLLATKPPMEFFPIEVARAEVTRESPARIGWLLVDRQGSSVLSFVAQLEETSPTETRVSVEIVPPPGGRHDKVARGLEENPAIADFYRAAMIEQIAAALEKRDFDMAAIQGKMMAAAISTMPRMQKRLDEAVKQEHARNRDNIEKAYREEAQGGGGYRSESAYGASEPAFGEPMDPATGSGNW